MSREERIDLAGKREAAYHCIETRRPMPPGGACSILTRRYDGRVELLFHGDPHTSATLTDAQAQELADALTRAVRAR